MAVVVGASVVVGTVVVAGTAVVVGAGVVVVTGAGVGAAVGAGAQCRQSVRFGDENCPLGQNSQFGTGNIGVPLTWKRVVLLLNWPAGHSAHFDAWASDQLPKYHPALMGAGTH